MEKLCCLQYDVRYWSTSTKPLVVSSQVAASFTQTSGDTAKISKFKDLCIEGLHSQSTHHFKRQTSERVSHNLWPSYTSHVISSYYVSRRIIASPHVYRNTLIHTHNNSHNVLTCRISLDKLVLPAAKFFLIVKLILIYESWSCVKLSTWHPVVLGIILG